MNADYFYTISNCLVLDQPLCKHRFYFHDQNKSLSKPVLVLVFKINKRKRCVLTNFPKIVSREISKDDETDCFCTWEKGFYYSVNKLTFKKGCDDATI